MKLRTRLNLIVAGLTATFLVVTIGSAVQTMRAAVAEEIAAANRVASQVVGHLATSTKKSSGRLLRPVARRSS
jgi:hypothetical protein